MSITCEDEGGGGTNRKLLLHFCGNVGNHTFTGCTIVSRSGLFFTTNHDSIAVFYLHERKEG